MTVKPSHFVKAMRDRWAQEYGLKSSGSLEQAWHEMALTFNDHIQGKVTDEWSVLRLPTGSGKTQGLALYCSLLSEQKYHPGVLIITKFTDEIDSLVKIINQRPYVTTAFAEHGKLKERLTPEEMQAVPVLAITHSMHRQTLNTSLQNNNAEVWWKRFTEWERGSRKLIVVDEALDVIEPVCVSHDILRMVRGLIPRWMELDQAENIQMFDKLISKFDEWEREYSKEYDSEIVDVNFWSEIKQESIAALCNDLCQLPLSKMIVGREDKGQIVRRFKEIFFDILYVLSNQSWYERKNRAGTLNSSYVALPTHISQVVIMDATARQSCIYDLLGSIPNFRPIPDNVRSYENVNLHVLHGYQNSKYHLQKPEQDEQHFVDVLNALVPTLPRNSKFLFVTFKEVSKKFAKVKATYKNCKIAYWGDMNGKNKWSDCTTIVIYGLPRLDKITPQSTILAFDNWHKKTQKKHISSAIIEEMPDDTVVAYEYDDLITEKKYEQGHAASEVIQAINRVQCRKITNDDGGCSKTDIYLLFNKGDEFERVILEAIEKEMPRIKIISSNFPIVHNKKVRSKLGQEIIHRLIKLPVQEYKVIELVDQVHAETGIGSKASRMSFTRSCKDANSAEAKALAEVGYKYLADAKGGSGNAGVFRPIS